MSCITRYYIACRTFTVTADIFEVMPGHEMPGQGAVRAFMSSSLQISPGIAQGDGRPTNGHDLNSSTDRW